MPTYDYECLVCSHTFEKFQSIKARPLRKCPKCGGRVRRLIGAGAGVIFKGSGFYETDYKHKGSAKPPGSSDSPCPSCPAKAENKSDGKPDAKSEKKD